MLVELKVVEQRFAAVQEVLAGIPVTEVARRCGVSRQTVHRWLARYADAEGLAGLADRSCRPASCPHQMPAELEAQVVAARIGHPGWGPDRIVYELARRNEGLALSRSSVYRALVRHHLIDPTQRKRKRSDYRRWERDRPMELWQMDVMGGVHLTDGTELKVVTGIDDYSRFVVCAKLVARATAQPVCQALREALERYGLPEQILTDNGKVFTARFGPGPGPVMFDQICHDNGIKHLLTAPYSPTTTGKVERLHKTMRREHFSLHDREFPTVVKAQQALDEWLVEYNTDRPHQALGMRPPIERFRFARPAEVVVESDQTVPATQHQPSRRVPGVTRWVDRRGTISLARFEYRVGPVFAGQLVEAVVDGGLVQIYHQGVLVATHTQRLRPDDTAEGALHGSRMRVARAATSGMSVLRIADNNGNVSFAGTMYSAGRAWRGLQLDVRIVGASVQISKDEQVIRVHAIRHDRSKEHGAYANPVGRPRKNKPRTGDPATAENLAASAGQVKATAAPRSA